MIDNDVQFNLFCAKRNNQFQPREKKELSSGGYAQFLIHPHTFTRSVFLFNRVKSQRDFILRYIICVLFQLRPVRGRMICVHVHRVL